MCNGLEEAIAEYRPDVCVLEDSFLATNVKVSMKLGQVRGVVLLVAERAGQNRTSNSVYVLFNFPICFSKV